MINVDLLILGGGCAGLGLARCLVKLGSRAPSTLVLEKRALYLNDRTWCFWANPDGQWDHAGVYQWSKFTVGSGDARVKVHCPTSPYTLLSSRVFYDKCTSAIDSSSHVALKLDTNVLIEPRKENGRWLIESSQGTVSASMVVDTRPPTKPLAEEPVLWQSFYGKEIECDLPVFNSEQVELMTFSIPHTDRVAFTYVLPTSPTKALVEFTVFGAQAFSADQLSNNLDREMSQRCLGGRFDVIRAEHGQLPMGLSFKPSVTQDPSYIKVGLFAGGARPATGYAFQRIARWAEQCAQSLGQGAYPTPHARDSKTQIWLDTLFLNVLKSRPELGPKLFTTLFSKVRSDKVIRFLSDSATFADALAVVAALPSWPFIRQLIRPNQQV